MKDRIPTKILANGAIRYGVYDDAGTLLRYEYIKSEDEPTQEGDPLCKATLLPDDVATALGLSGNPHVKDALARLSTSVNPLQYVWEKYSYSLNVNVATTLTTRDISVAQYETSGSWFRVTYGDSYKIVGNEFLITNPTTVELHQGTWMNYLHTFDNKYISVTSSSWGRFCAKVVNSNMRQISNFADIDCYPITWTWTQTYISDVFSYNQNGYPQNDIQEQYYYIYKGRPQYIGARVASGSYIGTGTCGSANPVSLVFDFVPRLILVYIADASLNGLSYFIYGAGMTSEQIYYTNGYIATEIFSLNKKMFSWYVSSNTSDFVTAANQFNTSGQKYYYVAIG